MIPEQYRADAHRYDGRMSYRRCGRSGTRYASHLTRPLAQLRWRRRMFETGRAVLRRAFDLGVTHFDLANNYGPPYGSAEETFGRVMAADFRPYRDELIISTKAGYDMWPGPYGDGGSRKVSAGQPRPESQADGARLCRHFLLAPGGPDDAAGGDDGCARPRVSAGQGAVRRHFVLLRRVDAPRSRYPAVGRRAAS